jgi:uncharacterized protein
VVNKASSFKHKLDPGQQKFLAPVIRKIKENLGERLIAVILFGSQARAEAEQGSDWDLLLIAQGLPGRSLKRHIYLKSLLPPSSRGKVSILAKTPQEFESSLPPLYLDIAVDGIILFDPNGYAKQKIEFLRALIHSKGLKREKHDGELHWLWKEFPGFGWTLEWGESRK